jgi:hypothetical protein
MASHGAAYGMKSSRDRGNARRVSSSCQPAAAGGIVSRVSYELCALAGPHEVAAQAAGQASTAEVELSRGYGLVLITTQFGWPPPDRASSQHWAFNQALRQLGVTRGAAFDEFEAVNLGRHRHTEDWLAHRA